MLLMLYAGVVWGQDKYGNKKDLYSNVITVDLSKDSRIPSVLKKGTYIRFVLRNVNTFKVTGASLSKSENINFDTTQQLIDFQNSIQDKIRQLEKMTNEMAVKNSGVSDSVIVPKRESKNHQFTSLTEKLSSDIVKFDGSYKNIKSLEGFQKRLESIVSDSVFTDSLQVVSNAKKLFSYHFKEKGNDIESFNQIDHDFNVIKRTYFQLTSDYDQYSKLAKELSKSNVFQAEILNINDLYTKIIEKKFEISSNVKNAILLYDKIIKNQYTIVLPEQQLLDDTHTFTLQLKDKKGTVVHSYFPIKIQTYSGWKINFSAGYFLSFISNDNYSTYTSASGSKEVSKGNSDKVTHALGGLLHVYPNYPQWLVQPGFSFGLSLADNSSLGFYAGPSLFFLERNRLVTSFGYSFLKVKRLNVSNLVAMQEPNKYAFVNTADTEIRYDNVYKGAWFFGVTYNLSK